MSRNQNQAVVGRFAPSPTGDLHFGSLVAALASYCNAKAAGGRWLLRIDDLDTPRVVAGAARRILDQLAALGLVPDGPVMYQSERAEAYREAIDSLIACGHAFFCGCTRREAQAGRVGPEGPIYPGTCRRGLPAGRSARSVRLRVPETAMTVEDRVQGLVVQHLAEEVGDFVIRRADGITAYQLATVVDDAAQGVTEIVRGADLLSSSPRQRYLQTCLGLPMTAYVHTPVVVDHDNEKLGKRTGALSLTGQDPRALIQACLGLLGQADVSGDIPTMIAQAAAQWDASRIPARQSINRTAEGIPSTMSTSAHDPTVRDWPSSGN